MPTRKSLSSNRFIKHCLSDTFKFACNVIHKIRHIYRTVFVWSNIFDKITIHTKTFSFNSCSTIKIFKINIVLIKFYLRSSKWITIFISSFIESILNFIINKFKTYIKKKLIKTIFNISRKSCLKIIYRFLNRWTTTIKIILNLLRNLNTSFIFFINHMVDNILLFIKISIIIIFYISIIFNSFSKRIKL